MKRAAAVIFAILFASVVDGETPSTDVGQLQTLARDFWNWRVQYAPFTANDVNRLELVHPATGRLQTDWLRTRAFALGIGRQPTLAT